MRLFRKYLTDLLKYNLLVSIPGGWFGASMGRAFPEFFLLSFATVGFLGSIGLFHYFQSNEYCFYYNKGLGRLQLNLFAGSADLFLCIAGFAILHCISAK